MLRKATISDVEAMKQLINNYAKQELMLAKSLSELYEHIRDFYVYEENDKIIGCCALHVIWEDFAEILSLAVDPEYHKRGIGSELLNACLENGSAIGLKSVFTLTYAPGFFEKNGFLRVDKTLLPHKIWYGCIKCPKFPECDEIALVKKLK
ncbi:MAG: N-acetyltransferase [Methanosarcinaceae archaeon]|nr:N-acetyltransferase [Methanosarcinaceae archaeon]